MSTRLLLVTGSTRAASSNTSALRTVAAMAPSEVVTELDTSLAELPAFNPDDDVDPLPPTVAALRERISAADAVLFCTPEYAGALPGSFKNLLDWTVGGMAIQGKPVGWINISSMPAGARDAHGSLATVLRYVDARVIDGACAAVPIRRDQIGTNGLIDDPSVRDEFRRVIDALATAAD
ncbi:MAG: NADPH-dependent FMN reductase [Ilumatobacteraceae bacterium]